MAYDVITDTVASLKLFGYDCMFTALAFGGNGFVEMRIERFSDCFDTFHAHIGQGLFELLDDTLNAFYVVVICQVFRYVFKRALKIIYNRQEVLYDRGFDAGAERGNLRFMPAAQIDCVSPLTLQGLGQFLHMRNKLSRLWYALLLRLRH